MSAKFYGLLFSVLLAIALPAAAQPADDLESIPTHKNERVFSFSLSTNGLALGGVYRFKLPSYMHLGVSLEFFAIRDDDEFQFYDYYGYPYKINDRNRMFAIPLNIELKKRLFTNYIEDDFRPHLLVQSGVMYAMNFPREQNIFVDGRFETIQLDNEYRLTYNLLAGFGVDFTTRSNYFATIRPQYRYTFFTKEIAGKKDHSTFEIKFEIGAQF